MALLTEDEIAARLDALSGWRRGGDAIEREFELRDFAGSIELVNAIAPVAEEMNHHPDLAISWNRVTATLSTHSEGGLTDSDFELARRIDAVAPA